MKTHSLSLSRAAFSVLSSALSSDWGTIWSVVFGRDRERQEKGAREVNIKLKLSCLMFGSLCSAL